VHLRRAEPDLQAQPNLEIVYAKKSGLPFVYRRGSLLMALNPGSKAASAAAGGIPLNPEPLYSLGNCVIEKGIVRTEGQSFGVWRLTGTTGR